MKKYLLSILLLSYLYSESITIYSIQSAQYISDSNNGDSCCTPGTLGNFNATSMSMQSCWNHSVYNQCFQRKHTAIWSFDIREIPDNSNIINAEFSFNQSWEGYGYYIKVSTEQGTLTNTIASNLYNNPIWSDYSGNTPNSLNQNIIIPIEQILNNETTQLNILIYEDGSYIDNSGLNAPRITIEYEMEIQECSEMNQAECNSTISCDWIENLEWVSCSDINSQQECNAVGCSWYNGNYYACTICCWGEYELNNSYCDESEYQLGDINQDYIINIQDVIIIINLILNGEFILIADLNQDQSVNVIDILLIVDIILNN